MPEDLKLPTLIDNDPTDDRTLLTALRQLLPLAQAWDIATGYFEVGSLLALEGLWQPIESIRIVMGDETTKRTRQLLLETLAKQVEDSIEAVKERDDTLTGLDAVRAALLAQQIQVRVFAERKFHAKAHRLEARTGPVNFGIIGSSNFTRPGLTENIELNLFTTTREQLDALQAWFNDAWKRAEKANPQVLKVIDRHLREFTPFEIWVKALYEYCAGKEVPLSDWDEHESVVFRILSKYQQDGYRQALKIAETWGGAFICDGVGLGKTYIGAMLLEHHLHHGDRILVIVPKSARSVWESQRSDDPVRIIRNHYRRAFHDFVDIRNQTDFGRNGTLSEDDFAHYRDFIDVILIDEAHHFRTPSAYRSKMLRQLLYGKEKKIYCLTATPINNSLLDLYHLINYIARDRQDRFASLGIQRFRKHFTEAEKRLEEIMAATSAGSDVQAAAQDTDILRTDPLLKALVIQRSRKYVSEIEQNSDSKPLFPKRENPMVIPYSLKKVYAGLYDDLKAAFDKKDPLLKLALYNPEPFRKGAQDEKLLNRDKQVIGLIRTLLLKRLESSYKAFESSLEDLLRKMAAVLSELDPPSWEAWQARHTAQWETVRQHHAERQVDDDPQAEIEEGNEWEDVKEPALDGKPEEYELDKLLPLVADDMTLLVMLLAQVYRYLSPEKDDKMQQLAAYLQTDPRLAGQKVVIFTEFRDTARYLWKQLKGLPNLGEIEEMDSTRKVDRETVIKRFAPYYNCKEDELPRYAANQICVLISTDVLSEGLNLQDATRVINYDLHWNPVRLMQRIGRVDRRLNPANEKALGRQDQDPLKVYVFNFLPPDEINDLLHLFQRVSGKLLRISKTLGIEAPVLTPDDDFEALRLLNEKFEGQKNADETLRVELNRLQRENPGLFEELPNYPRRMFSGKRTGEGQTRGLFCCYRFPAMTEGESGEVRWNFRCTEDGTIWESEHLEDIANAIRSTPDTPRSLQASAEELKAWRKDIERQCVERHLRDLQAPMDEKATLLCWMEVC